MKGLNTLPLTASTHDSDIASQPLICRNCSSLCIPPVVGVLKEDSNEAILVNEHAGSTAQVKPIYHTNKRISLS
jgi:hypothetical protein